MADVNISVSGAVEKLVTVGQINGNFINNGVMYLVASHEVFKTEHDNELNDREFVDLANQYFQTLKGKFGVFEAAGMESAVRLEDFYILPQLKDVTSGDIMQLDRADVMLNKLLGETRELYLQGAPGSGKTAFLKFILWKTGELAIKAIPVFVSLNAFKAFCKMDPSYTLQDYLIRDIVSYGFPRGFARFILKNGLALLLLDGLDEIYVRDDEKYFINTQIEDFKKLFQTKLILTSRSKDYRFSDFGLKHLELLPFNKEMVDDFLSRSFVEDTKNDFLAKLDELYNFTFSSRNQTDNPAKDWADDRVIAMGGKLLSQEIANVVIRKKPLPQVASNPLLLSLLVFNYRLLKKLSTSKNALFSTFVSFLVEKWLHSYNSEFLRNRMSSEEAYNILYELAYHSFCTGHLLINRQSLFLLISKHLNLRMPERGINPDDIIKTFRTDLGLLTDEDDDSYRFIYPQIQEYLTARFLNQGDNYHLLFEQQFFLKKEWSSVLLLLTEAKASNDQYRLLYASATASVLQYSPAVRNRVSWAFDKSGKDDGSTGVYLIFYYLAISLYYHVGERPIYASMRLAHKVIARVTDFRDDHIFSLFTFMQEVKYIAKKLNKKTVYEDALLLVLYDEIKRNGVSIKTLEDAHISLEELQGVKGVAIPRLEHFITVGNETGIMSALENMLKNRQLDIRQQLEPEAINILSTWLDMLEIYLEAVSHFGCTILDYTSFFDPGEEFILKEPVFADCLTSRDYGDLGQLIYPKDKSKAIALLSQAIALNPFVGNYYYGRGAMRSQNGDHENALMDYLSARNLYQAFGHNPQYLTGLATIYRRLGDLDRALECYRNVIQINGRDQVSPRWFQIEIYMERRSYPEILVLLEELRQLLYEQMHFHYCTAYYRLLMRQFEEVLEAIGIAIDNAYYLEESYFIQCYAYIQLARYELVYERINKDLLNGEFGYIFYPLLWNAYILQGNVQGAGELSSYMQERGLIAASETDIAVPISPGHIDARRFGHASYTEDFKLVFDSDLQTFTKVD